MCGPPVTFSGLPEGPQHPLALFIPKARQGCPANINGSIEIIKGILNVKKTIQFGLLTAAIALTSGCATPITSAQQNELRGYQGKGLAVEEKNPAAAAALGILPGGGSFYTRNYGIGVVNLLLWPASILWDPMSGYDGAQSVNYYATKQVINQRKGKEERDIEDSLLAGAMDKNKYIIEKRRIDEKYSPY